VKPAAFTYQRVDTAQEAVERLGELGPDAKVLAGGQSLVPMMNFRLARPPAIVDITRARELRGMSRAGSMLRIGALTTHAEVEHAGAELDRGYELMRRAATFVGHAPIRARGTFGGSLAHADPAAEWCMLAVALEATLEIVTSSGTRDVPVDRFLLGYFTTALEPDEVLGAVRFATPCRRAAIEEFARRHGDFAIVAVVVALPDDEPPRVVIGGVDAVPVRARDAERIVAEADADPECFADAGRAAAAEIEPGSDVHAGAEYRRELTAVLVRRALERAVGHGS
jgi:aerobic carbon-monoxide dehydrogenase medium subunit